MECCDDSPVIFAGVSKRDISTHSQNVTVNDPLYVKVLVLDDGNKRIAVMAIDTVAIGGPYDVKDDFLGRVKIFAEKDFGIHDVLINATHTHTVMPMLCDDLEQFQKTCEAITEACNGMVPVKIGSGAGYEDSFTINRTLRLSNGNHWTIRQANPCPKDDEVEDLGPIDPRIGILRVDRMDGTSLAVVYTFSCHPLLGVPDGSVTANFPGFASQVIEENFHTTAIYLQGTGGDVTEVLYKDITRPMDSKPAGLALGLSTLKALQNIKTGNETMSHIAETIRLPRRTDIPMRIEQLKKERYQLLKSLRNTSLNFKTFLPLYIKTCLNPDYPSDYSYRYMQEEARGLNDLRRLDELNKQRIEKYLQNIVAMEKLARIENNISTLETYQKLNEESGEDTVTTEIHGLRVGDFVMVTSPTETLVEIGLNIRKQSSYEKTFVISPTNGYFQYGAPKSYYDKGGYEVTECMLGSDWQELYEEKALEIINRL